MWCLYCDEYHDEMGKDIHICERCHSYLDYCDLCDGRVMSDGSHCTCRDCIICTECKVCSKTGRRTTFYFFTDVCTHCLKNTCYKCKSKRNDKDDPHVLCMDCNLTRLRVPLIEIFPVDIARIIGSYDDSIEQNLKVQRTKSGGGPFKIDAQLPQALKMFYKKKGGSKAVL